MQKLHTEASSTKSACGEWRISMPIEAQALAMTDGGERSFYISTTEYTDEENSYSEA